MAKVPRVSAVELASRMVEYLEEGAYQTFLRDDEDVEREVRERRAWWNTFATVLECAAGECPQPSPEFRVLRALTDEVRLASVGYCNGGTRDGKDEA